MSQKIIVCNYVSISSLGWLIHVENEFVIVIFTY
jgi:hypothetical protein